MWMRDVKEKVEDIRGKKLNVFAGKLLKDMQNKKAEFEASYDSRNT